MIQTEHHPQFFTATILEWKHLLADDRYKEIIVNSLRFLVSEKRVVVNSFVVMSNHIHFSPLLVFPWLIKRNKVEKQHTALVVSFSPLLVFPQPIKEPMMKNSTPPSFGVFTNEEFISR